jgi:hypothetical protein
MCIKMNERRLSVVVERSEGVKGESRREEGIRWNDV